jgi:PAS domain S-box-containing protein
MGTSSPFPDGTKLTFNRQRHEQSAHLQAGLIELAYDAIIVRDPASRIVSWNRGAEQLYGWTAQEAIGQPVTLIFPPERQDEFAGIMERITRGEQVDSYETTRIRKDGTTLPVSITISPIRNGEGQ